ncbi:MAG: carboxylesterase family protein [Asgard group archaeon]|nr:carboxylesterase family protein [Asgard group archaeon]
MILHTFSLTNNADNSSISVISFSLRLLIIKPIQIEYFGGDYENITVFSQSARRLSVSCLMIMPTAKDLFKKGIFESNVATLYDHKPDNGEEFNKNFFSRWD